MSLFDVHPFASSSLRRSFVYYPHLHPPLGSVTGLFVAVVLLAASLALGLGLGLRRRLWMLGLVGLEGTSRSAV